MDNLNFNLGALELGTTVSGNFGFHRLASSRACSSIRLHNALTRFLELCHAITMFEGFYEVSILNVGLRMSPVGYALSLLFSGALVSLVQAFFTYRIQVVTEKRRLAYACWALSTSRFAGTTWLGVLLLVIPLEEFSAKWTSLATTVWLIGAFSDVIIAASLSTDLLRKGKRLFLANESSIRSSSRRSVSGILLERLPLLMMFAFSLVAIGLVVCFMAMPDNLIWAAVGLGLPRMFSISLLASSVILCLIQRLPIFTELTG
ncbi:hypothetical protein BDN72DRAFT_894429 [Pluteus cervinus]|uniref:Uncharacterized protein n=1 Tax=Pluteus cervinus TaxID=181527 RepID=A0ACD3B553_9AGAR|nr:hypothetical protein BDN72DRAFT_894429 [Pluteus cervinus]